MVAIIWVMIGVAVMVYGLLTEKDTHL